MPGCGTHSGGTLTTPTSSWLPSSSPASSSPARSGASSHSAPTTSTGSRADASTPLHEGSNRGTPTSDPPGREAGLHRVRVRAGPVLLGDVHTLELPVLLRRGALDDPGGRLAGEPAAGEHPRRRDHAPPGPLGARLPDGRAGCGHDQLHVRPQVPPVRPRPVAVPRLAAVLPAVAGLAAGLRPARLP